MISSSNLLLLFQGVLEQRLRAHLGSFGITGNLALQSMYTLSGLFLAFLEVLFIFIDRPESAGFYPISALTKAITGLRAL